MTVIALALFGGDERLITEDSMQQITAAIEGFLEARMLALLRLPQIPLTARGRAGKLGQVHLRKTLAEVVDDRWHGRITGDFLSGMIEALRQRFPEAEARALSIDNAATFYLAGHETTANALTWTLFMLAAQPALQEQLAAEAKEAVAGGDDDARHAFPTAPVPDGIHAAIPAGAPLRSPGRGPGPLASGRSSLATSSPSGPGCCTGTANCDDLDAFRIDRFAEKGGRHRFQYLPFGAGPRTCVGAQFATAEALTILVHWLSKWRFADAGQKVRPAGMVTLRPAGGLMLRLQRR